MLYVDEAPEEPRFVRMETREDFETMTTSASSEVTVICLSVLVPLFCMSGEVLRELESRV